jgi:hypothetical protein
MLPEEALDELIDKARSKRALRAKTQLLIIESKMCKGCASNTLEA